MRDVRLSHHRQPLLQQGHRRLGHQHHVPLPGVVFLGIFTGYSVPFLHSAGPIGIGVTAFILVVAALTLISDFGFIESGSRYDCTKEHGMVRRLWHLGVHRLDLH